MQIVRVSLSMPVHNIQKETCYVNEIRALCILKNCVFVLELGR